ncbi:MAG: hypothetical protein M3Z26_02155 [Bacteroidota bacterium]|nr:hypothetical protein [Bacteroidota bacterium]
MKIKYGILAIGILITSTVFGQDTTLHSRSKNKITYKKGARIHSSITSPNRTKTNAGNSNLHDTRLGSSSPKYNTYKKNDNGAGAVTNNPNKGQSGKAPAVPQFKDSTK